MVKDAAGSLDMTALAAERGEAFIEILFCWRCEEDEGKSFQLRDRIGWPQCE